MFSAPIVCTIIIRYDTAKFNCTHNMCNTYNMMFPNRTKFRLASSLEAVKRIYYKKHAK